VRRSGAKAAQRAVGPTSPVAGPRRPAVIGHGKPALPIVAISGGQTKVRAAALPALRGAWFGRAQIARDGPRACRFCIRPDHLAKVRQPARRIAMKAAWFDRYGPPDVVRIRDVPTPEAGPGQVLVRVRASTVSSGDRRIRAADFPPGLAIVARAMFGLFRPRRHVLGVDFAGEVAAVGDGVTGFRPGQRLAGFTGSRMGGHAEYVLLRTRKLAAAEIPEGIGPSEAAALVFGGSAALQFLRDFARLQPGEKVLVVGASGAVGAAAVQIARALGAEPTGVASAANRTLVDGLGATGFIAYDETDPAEGPAEFDVVIDTQGRITPEMLATRVRPGGRLALVSTDLPGMLGARRLGKRRGIRVITGVAAERADDIAYLLGLAAEGRLRPVIDATFPLEDATAAHARADSGHKRGAVVLTMEEAAA
jgi:NADPH:quinone reductase-like Zn-dependent oxidoreductase